jgi:hypothetical protein
MCFLWSNRNISKNYPTLPASGFVKLVAMPPRGKPFYSRLHTKDFDIERTTTVRPPKLESPERVVRDHTVRELREQGLSYPAIAKAMRISVGSAWNAINGSEKI